MNLMSNEARYLSYRDFLKSYYKDCEGLVNHVVKHALLPENKLY